MKLTALGYLCYGGLVGMARSSWTSPEAMAHLARSLSSTSVTKNSARRSCFARFWAVRRRFRRFADAAFLYRSETTFSADAALRWRFRRNWFPQLSPIQQQLSPRRWQSAAAPW